MREVKRIAEPGEYIKLARKKYTFDEVGDILKVDFVSSGLVQVLGKGHSRETNFPECKWSYFRHEYVVLEEENKKRRKKK